MLSIIEKININVDEKIVQKLGRMTHVKEVEEKRDEKIKDRKDKKQLVLEDAKKRLKQRKRKGNKDEHAIKHDSKGHMEDSNNDARNTKSSKKMVSFA